MATYCMSDVRMFLTLEKHKDIGRHAGCTFVDGNENLPFQIRSRLTTGALVIPWILKLLVRGLVFQDELFLE